MGRGSRGRWRLRSPVGVSVSSKFSGPGEFTEPLLTVGRGAMGSGS